MRQLSCIHFVKIQQMRRFHEIIIDICYYCMIYEKFNYEVYYEGGALLMLGGFSPDLCQVAYPARDP